MTCATKLLTVLHQRAIQIAVYVAALFAPISGIMITVGLAIIADTITGVWRATKLKETITSRKLSQIASKMFLYQGTIIMFYLIDKFILGDILGAFFSIELLLTKVIALVLASVEVFSIDENIKAVKGTGLWSAFKKLTSRAKEISTEVQQIKSPAKPPKAKEEDLI